MADVIAAVSIVILFELLCVVVATLLVRGILMIAEEVIELWREIKE